MTDTELGIVENVLLEKLKGQPWYKTYINTTIVVITLAVNVLWILVTLGINVDPTIIGGVAGLIQALGAIGVKLAPNGVTPRQIKELESYVGKHRLGDDS